MELMLIVIGVLLLGVLLLQIYQLFFQPEKSLPEPETEGSFSLMQEQLQLINRNVNEQINKMRDRVSHDLRDVQGVVGEMKGRNDRVLDLAEKLHGLEKVLTNQKQRGNLGRQVCD